ncbi:MAG: acyl-CoA/acyl-ACP dehydrogenase, partial [Gemmatimonadota bacterium]|nr:acyl-CoA/acyl-ACP dehydrogenase [Gemmatimonadota bacterium]
MHQTTARRPIFDTAHRIAADVAAPAADAVDRDARFPTEAIDALRAEGLLGALVPSELGGPGHTFGDVASVCTVLGQHCASAAMVYAMHQIQVATLVRHRCSSEFFRDYLADLATHQPLIASVTSEIGVGGDLRSSVCAIERDDAGFRVTKRAPVISYGDTADDFLVTARRAPEAVPSDQALVLVRRSDAVLERTSGWDALGFRGTCSNGFTFSAQGHAEQILPVPFADIASRTMLPTSHILWSSLWLGIATAAMTRARAFVRGEARKSPGAVPPAAIRAAEAVNALQSMRANVERAIQEYERRMDDPDALGGLGFALQMNNLKIASSNAVVHIVGQALLICGMAGYKADSPYALGRHLRDSYGAM